MKNIFLASNRRKIGTWTIFKSMHIPRSLPFQSLKKKKKMTHTSDDLFLSYPLEQRGDVSPTCNGERIPDSSLLIRIILQFYNKDNEKKNLEELQLFPKWPNCSSVSKQPGRSLSWT